MFPLKLTKKPVDNSKLINEAQLIANRLAEKIDPRAIFLFGSVARGDANDQSDFDFLIICDDRQEINLKRKLSRELRPLSRDFASDVIWMSVDDYENKRNIGGIAMVVHEEGVQLYGESI